MEAFDDDFGELYADVEVQTTAAVNDVSDFARLYLEPEQEDDVKAASGKLEDDFITEAKKVDPVSGESTHSGSENSEPCSGKVVDGGVGSDSEDDLKIVLNDEDCKGFNVGSGRSGGVVTRVGYGEDDDDGDLGKNGKCGDQIAEGLELVGSNGHAGQNGNGLKVAYSSQFFHHKFGRTGGSTFLNNKKVSRTGALSSYCSPLTNGRRNGNPCVYNQTAFAAANLIAVQCGYGLFLPRHWSILDVNIDTLEEKPWRIPGVDITDYFNFGFDENSWKQYCEYLKEIWQESFQSGIPVDEYLKMNQVVFLKAMREETDQAVTENIPSPSSESEVPKGKAIQVEDSIGERQPSMEWHPRGRNRDSDVIEIKLESPGGCSGSGNSNVHEPSEDGEFSANNNRNIVSSGSEHCGALFEEHLEEFKKSDESSGHERNDLVPSVDKDIDYQHQTVQPLEDTAEASEREIQAEKGIGIDTYSTDPGLIEAELSLSDQEFSLTSYSDSDSEATENSVHGKHEEQRSPLRRSVNSVTKLKESTPSSQKNLKKDRNSINMDYYLRNEAQIRKEQRHRSGRLERGSKLNKLSEHENDVLAIHISGARDLPLLDHELIDYDRQKDRPRGVGLSKRRNFSYHNYKETERSCHYGGENVADDLTNTVYTKYSYRKGHNGFRENITRYAMRNWDESEYALEQRTVMADNEDSERDWYEVNAGCSGDDLSPLSYRESRQFLSKHFNFLAKEGDIERRRMHCKPHFRHRNCHNDHWFDEPEPELMNSSCRMSISVTHRGNKHEQQLPHVVEEFKRAARWGRHHDRDLDGFWSVRMEDECQKYTHHGTLNSRYNRESFTDSLRNYVNVCDPRTNKNFLRHRHKHTRDDRGSDWYCGYDDDNAEDEDYIIDPVKEYELGRRRYGSPLEVLRHHHEVDAEMATFPYERSHARYESLHDKVQIGDVQLQQHQLNMFRRGSDGCMKRSSKIMYRGNRGQASLSCRNSVDLVDEEVKSRGRSFRARRLIHNGRLENLDERIAKKHKPLLKFDEPHRKTIISKSKVEYNKSKRLQSIPGAGHKEGLDIEEGQIVTEEPCTEASLPRRDVSERAALTGCMKKRMLQKKNNSDQDNNEAGYDNQRILETLAKMEKRRERFKQPITMKKEAEESSKLNDDLVVDTDEIKQHRPVRKRRWGVS